MKSMAFVLVLFWALLSLAVEPTEDKKYFPEKYAELQQVAKNIGYNTFKLHIGSTVRQRTFENDVKIDNSRVVNYPTKLYYLIFGDGKKLLVQKGSTVTIDGEAGEAFLVKGIVDKKFYLYSETSKINITLSRYEDTPSTDTK